MGPIVIGQGAKIGANSIIQGPCYLGPYCQIRALSIVKDATTIGRLCKTGGDHVKTGINTRLMPGTYIGFASALVGSNIPPRFIPSFSFWSDKGMEPYD